MGRAVMGIANLSVSIPRGRGRRVVTLYEALFRKLASGRIYRRAAVMDFMRLVLDAASLTPDPAPAEPSPAIGRLQEHLDGLIASGADVDQIEHIATRFHALLDEMVSGTLSR